MPSPVIERARAPHCFSRTTLSRFMMSLLLAGAVMGCSNNPADATSNTSAVNTAGAEVATVAEVSADNDATVVDALQANLTASGIEETIVSAVPTDMEGIYWVTAQGLPSFFTDKSGKHIIQGQIISVGDGAPVDISAALAANTAKEALQAVDKKEMIIYPEAKAVPTAQVETPIAAAMPVIRGTVGEFIRATLPDAHTRLAEDGVIRCFIETIALHTEQVQTPAGAEATSNGNNSDVTSQSFDFSNYGYQPLAADYLTRFAAMTQAVGQFALSQGKTDVELPRVGQRASNDPRGQHPNYQETSQESAVLSVPTERTTTDEASLVDTEQNEGEVDAHNLEAAALASQAQTDDISADREQMLELESNKATESDSVQTQAAQAEEKESEQLTKEDNQAKSKTTIASYKNMIENVAEQLLPQSGMFNLTTPKVPKARSRKPKADHKKLTQVEKAEANDTSDDTSDDS